MSNETDIFGDANRESVLNYPEEDVFKILIATDIHLGYNEADPIRGDDSFITFEEILKHGEDNKVDFILLGGDLFHESKPTPSCLHRCIALLRRYTLGDKPVSIEFLSDQSRNFRHLKVPTVNYEDPNLNVSIPVFSIHGNHDDPIGNKQLSALDLLSETGLVNYFGKWTDLTKIDIYPLLMRKGCTNLALYGLSHIKDERLSRLFKDNKVSMSRPSDSESWFSMLVLHQNRAQNRGPKNYIPEEVLPRFLQLVVWGHEHDCLIDPQTTANGPAITQPGSSVATSLAAGESLPKHIGLLHVYKNSYEMYKIKLKTVRPFVFRDATITKGDDILHCNVNTHAQEQVAAKVEEMLLEADRKLNPDEPRQPKLPLIRLIVNFTDEAMMFNAIKMGQRYIDRVANPVDMLTLKMKRQVYVQKQPRKQNAMCDMSDEIDGDFPKRVEELIETYFKEAQHQPLVFSVKGLTEAMVRYIDKNDTDALDTIVKHQYDKSLNKLLEVEGDMDEYKLDELLVQFREERQTNENEEMHEMTQVLDNTTRQVPTIDIVLSSDDEQGSGSTTTSRLGTSPSRPPRGRGSRGPRRARARAGRY